MTTTFQEFLEKKAAQGGSQRRRERKAEWLTAVDRLLKQIRDWLAEADPNHVLEVIPLTLVRVEPDLGVYEIAGLKIDAVDAEVQVLPNARGAIGTVHRPGEAGVKAEGRVEVTDGVRRHILYRALDGGQERWYVLDDEFQAAPLDRTRFEETILDLMT